MNGSSGGSPRSLLDQLRGLAFTVLFIAVLLYISVRLIEAVLPVLLGLAAGAVVLGGLWLLWQRHRHQDW